MREDNLDSNSLARVFFFFSSSSFSFLSFFSLVELFKWPFDRSMNLTALKKARGKLGGIPKEKRSDEMA